MRKRTAHHLMGATLASLSLLLAACQPPPPQGNTASANPAAASNPTDADVTANVQAALLREEALKGASINVETLKGDVKLAGVLDSPEKIERAVAAARGANGTHSVNNQLTVGH
jgi:osmotically-inducible protein OsmY